MYLSILAFLYPSILSIYRVNLSSEAIYLSGQPIYPCVHPSIYLFIYRGF